MIYGWNVQWIKEKKIELLYRTHLTNSFTNQYYIMCILYKKKKFNVSVCVLCGESPMKCPERLCSNVQKTFYNLLSVCDVVYSSTWNTFFYWILLLEIKIQNGNEMLGGIRYILFVVNLHFHVSYFALCLQFSFIVNSYSWWYRSRTYCKHVLFLSHCWYYLFISNLSKETRTIPTVPDIKRASDKCDYTLWMAYVL